MVRGHLLPKATVTTTHGQMLLLLLLMMRLFVLLASISAGKTPAQPTAEIFLARFFPQTSRCWSLPKSSKGLKEAPRFSVTVARSSSRGLPEFFDFAFQLLCFPRENFPPTPFQCAIFHPLFRPSLLCFFLCFSHGTASFQTPLLLHFSLPGRFIFHYLRRTFTLTHAHIHLRARVPP